MDKDKFIGTRLDGRYELTELIGEGGLKYWVLPGTSCAGAGVV